MKENNEDSNYETKPESEIPEVDSHDENHRQSRSRSTSVVTCIRKDSRSLEDEEEVNEADEETNEAMEEKEEESDEEIDEEEEEQVVKNESDIVNSDSCEKRDIKQLNPNENANECDGTSKRTPFYKGFSTGIIASLPLSTCIGFETKDSLGPMSAILRSLAGTAMSALLCGTIATLAELFLAKKTVKQLTASPKSDDEITKKTSLKTELTEGDIEFIMANTDFTRDSVIKWFASFKKQCPDCRLDRPSFINFYKNLIPGNSEVKDEFAEAVFIAFDSDNNGYVDFGEFLIAFWIKARGKTDEKLLWLFEVYDSDKSEYISLNELTHMLRLVFCLKNMKDDPTERAEYVMQLVDKNSDGQLSKEEFIEGCLKDAELRKLLET